MSNKRHSSYLTAVILYSLIILLFGAAFVLGPYSTLANIWLSGVGIACLNLVNIGTLGDTVARFKRNIASIKTDIATLNELDPTGAFKRLRSNLKLQKKSDNEEVKDHAEDVLTFLKSEKIKSLDDINHYIDTRDKAMSTSRIFHGLSMLTSLGSFITGTSLQTKLLEDAATETPSSLSQVPTSIFTGGGYVLSGFSHMGFLIALSLVLEKTEWLKETVHAETMEPPRPRMR